MKQCMEFRHLNKIEKLYFLIRIIFGAISVPFTTIANWATDKLNTSYYKSAME